MTNEELNTALYKKVFAEQEKYREWLLSQPPDEILNQRQRLRLQRLHRKRQKLPVRLP